MIIFQKRFQLHVWRWEAIADVLCIAGLRGPRSHRVGAPGALAYDPKLLDLALCPDRRSTGRQTFM